MTTRYVGPGGNDGNSGLSWALRKLTLNGVEDTPVVAGDIVYVGPGVYRELLTCDVSGSSGNPITYIGDVTGEHTDGVGGIVRISGSDNDQTATRANCITGTTKNFRTFQGFVFDTTTGSEFASITSTDLIIQDCSFWPSASNCINISGLTQASHTIQRCVFLPGGGGYPIQFTHTAVVDNSAHLVSNCYFLGSVRGINIVRVGGITVKNCTFCPAGGGAIRIETAITVGQTITVNNCIFAGCSTALWGTALGEIVENYNAFYANSTDRNTVNTGANSNAYPPLFQPPVFLSGFVYPQRLGTLSSWSQIARLAGTGMATDDLFGMARPATDSKKSWGAMQYQDVIRSSTQAQAGTYSLKMADAGRTQFIIPTTNVSTVFSVYVYREADYAGTSPQLVVKQPGQSDVVITDAGAAGGWNLLTTTLTPAALPTYVIVELVSNNTAVAGSYNTYFDTLAVS